MSKSRFIIKITNHECLKPLQSRLPSTRNCRSIKNVKIKDQILQRIENSTLGERFKTSTLGEIVSLEKSNKNVIGLRMSTSYQSKKQKKDDEDEQLLSVFKQIHINLPFLEALIHMPKGAKVLKDLLSHKEKLKKAASSVKLSEECSAIIQRNLPQKERDPGSFTLPCLIRPLAVKNALDDLWASTSSQSESYTSTPSAWKSALVVTVKLPWPKSILSYVSAKIHLGTLDLTKSLALLDDGKLKSSMDLMMIVEKKLVLEMFVDESLEMIMDESLDMIVDESLMVE
nr:hypothetical protein [Tanacetum cinerariifolium]